MKITVDTHTTGPLFSGVARSIIMRGVERSEAEAAEAGQRTVRELGRQAFVVRTGHYESNVDIDRTLGGQRVHVDRVIYGPWLEGVSARNHTTRFKGYALFRRAGQSLERNIDRHVDRSVRRLVQELNG